MLLNKLSTVAIPLIFLIYLTTCSDANAPKYIAPASAITLYSSSNLLGHTVNPECNPGGTTSCECTASDVALNSNADYGIVTANSNETNTWVNAIGTKQFLESFPNGTNISLGTYKYSYQVKLPNTPLADITQRSNPQAVHLMIQLWDGRNALWNANKWTAEAAIYWSLNPWESTYGKLFIYTTNLQLYNTGITITPDNQWHTFELIANFETRKYVSITIDGQTIDLTNIDLCLVEHTDWGNEVAINITTESESTYPGDATCSTIFTWSTYFRNIQFIKI
ncbi:MAG: hypothetical protein HQK50_16785 [Oligoflexia bacterium]|nr:hypothetical protein [Oligoflexia bacterium]